ARPIPGPLPDLRPEPRPIPSVNGQIHPANSAPAGRANWQRRIEQRRRASARQAVEIQGRVVLTAPTAGLEINHYQVASSRLVNGDDKAEQAAQGESQSRAKRATCEGEGVQAW